MFCRTLVVIALSSSIIAVVISSAVPETSVNKLHEVEADCNFTVHDKGPNGKEVTGTSLNQELYYKIKCRSEPNYCLWVTNCTVSTEAPEQKPYPIIDEHGCTTEPSLFEHVQYEDDFTAGIYNPFPIRFRGQKSAVRFQCQTTLRPAIGSEKCKRPLCVWNEYSKEANTSAKP